MLNPQRCSTLRIKKRAEAFLFLCPSFSSPPSSSSFPFSSCPASSRGRARRPATSFLLQGDLLLSSLLLMSSLFGFFPVLPSLRSLFSQRSIMEACTMLRSRSAATRRDRLSWWRPFQLWRRARRRRSRSRRPLFSMGDCPPAGWVWKTAWLLLLLAVWRGVRPDAILYSTPAPLSHLPRRRGGQSHSSSVQAAI